MRISRILEFVGRAMFQAGVLILLFVAYQLWGTGIFEHRAQNHLQAEFNKSLGSTTTVPGQGPTTTTFPSVKCETPASGAEHGPPPAPPAQGSAIAHIRIPHIGVDKIVVQGVRVPDLKQGPGHYPTTSLPGQHGNASIAGHRTTYGAPFNRLDELNNGDAIFITTKQGAFCYEVADKKVVKPSDLSVLNNTSDDRLTLTTCNPKYSAATRLIVIGRLFGTALPASAPGTDSSASEPPPSNQEVTGTTAVTTKDKTPSSSSAPTVSLSAKNVPKAPTIIWGLIVAAVYIAIRVLAVRWRKWTMYLIGAPIFLFVLFIFFENVSRLLPANI